MVAPTRVDYTLARYSAATTVLVLRLNALSTKLICACMDDSNDSND